MVQWDCLLVPFALQSVLYKCDFYEHIFRKNASNLDRIHDLVEMSFYYPNMMPEAFRNIDDVFLVSWHVFSVFPTRIHNIFNGLAEDRF